MWYFIAGVISATAVALVVAVLGFISFARGISRSF